MYRPWVALAAATCCLLLGGCRGKEDSVSSSSPSRQAAETKTKAANATTFRLRIHPTLPEYSFTLVSDRSSDNSQTLQVKRIEIRRGGETEPFQIIEGLDAATPLQLGPPLSMVDMNFDGYGDIRLIELQPAGPNVPYLNWLFDPASGRFVESRALNEITSPQFDAATREIRSEWRDGPTRYGTDIYVYKQGEPVLVRKESKEYRQPGVYTLRVSQLVDGAWKTVEQREVREP
jgi:hypothetical protein